MEFWELYSFLILTVIAFQEKYDAKQPLLEPKFPKTDIRETVIYTV